LRGELTVFFSRSRKWKKIADAILVEVQHLISRLELQINKTINVSDDDYLLGFIDELCDLPINRAEQEGVKLDQVDKETILFLVIEQIYGKGAIDQVRRHYIGRHRACPSDSQETILARARPISELRVAKANLGSSTRVERFQAVHREQANPPDWRRDPNFERP
jgi:hypothetical protein